MTQSKTQSLKSKTLASEIERLEVFEGNVKSKLADFFSVKGDVADEVHEWEGDLSGVHWIGAKMQSGRIVVEGNGGRHIGSEMRGHSTRMGLAKATLPFGPELMLQRVVRLLSTVAQHIVVVAASKQELPPLPPDIIIARDRRESRGPLEGLLAGLSALASTGATAAYATGCDVPLLAPLFVTAMFEQLGDHDIAVPIDGQFTHSLAAVYRLSVLPEIEKLLAADQLRPAFLFDRVRTRKVLVDELRDADPDLSTLKNLNHPADYLSALESAGFQPEPAIVTALDRPHIG